MSYELIYDDYGNPCGGHNCDTALYFTADAEAIVAALNKATLYDALCSYIEPSNIPWYYAWEIGQGAKTKKVSILSHGQTIEADTLTQAIEEALAYEEGFK